MEQQAPFQVNVCTEGYKDVLLDLNNKIQFIDYTASVIFKILEML